VAPSVDSLFDPSENTWMSPGGISGRNSRKSTAAFAFVRPCGALILLQVSARVSLIAHGGTWSGLTCSVRGRESRRHAKRVLLIFVCKTCVLRAASGCYGSSRAVLEANALAMRLSSISGGRKCASLYRVTVYVVL
jgi:hypothetical protein